jgi:hypothetical protein
MLVKAAGNVGQDAIESKVMKLRLFKGVQPTKVGSTRVEEECARICRKD